MALTLVFIIDRAVVSAPGYLVSEKDRYLKRFKDRKRVDSQ